MVTQKTIAERLERFEAISGIKYSEQSIEIWCEHCGDYDEPEFIKICKNIEKSIKWHILPTLNDFYREKGIKWQYP